MSKNLRKFMELRRVNTVQLAKLSGVSRPSISLILSNKRRPISTQLQKLATALHVTVDDLLGTAKSDITPKTTDDLTAEEKEFLALYRKLAKDSWRKKAIDEILEGDESQEKK